MKIFRTRRQYPAAPPVRNKVSSFGVFFVENTLKINVEKKKKNIKYLFKKLLT